MHGSFTQRLARYEKVKVSSFLFIFHMITSVTFCVCECRKDCLKVWENFLHLSLRVWPFRTAMNTFAFMRGWTTHSTN